jgi:pyru_phos_dikin: pyruvate, phosphate dikinase
MGWADAARQLLVMTNADNPRDAQQAVDLGAEGIGLCRTEHMFFAEDRIKAVREMICARTVEERELLWPRSSRSSRATSRRCTASWVSAR